MFQGCIADSHSCEAPQMRTCLDPNMRLGLIVYPEVSTGWLYPLAFGRLQGLRATRGDAAA